MSLPGCDTIENGSFIFAIVGMESTDFFLAPLKIKMAKGEMS
jgi:hypothetical protein